MLSAEIYLERIWEILSNYVQTLIAGTSELHLGQVGGHTKCIDVTPTLSVGASYASGDYVGTNNVPMTFVDAARITGGTGLIMGAVLIDKKISSVAGELWLFDTAPTGLGADSVAFTISDADALRCIGIIPFNTYYASTLNSISPGAPATPLAFQCLANSKNLYGAFVTRGAPAWIDQDVTFRLRVLQD